ncbi:protein MpEXL8 [Marchantia polymorpha subsp. ruderalis]|nr:hypothetical protein MARPO_0062s0012 [Marchantia polymorpha]BBN16295.1 hypothetical protein Mp_7g05130 [Marchantia polymorpha subsp. ruderalis]|eukprot:PTQ36586.1 hypothetical protein MARPO_0062s0012 [Marchantia polymorpha]
MLPWLRAPSGTRSKSQPTTRKMQFLLGFWRCALLVYIFFELDAFETAKVADRPGPARIASVLTHDRAIERTHDGRPDLHAEAERSAAAAAQRRKLAHLVEEPAPVLNYHYGPLMNSGASVPVHVIWYGDFSAEQKAVVCDFFRCFSATKHKTPSVTSWWNVTQGYKDDKGCAVAGSLHLGAQVHDRDCSRGRALSEDDLQAIVLNALNATDPASRLPLDASAVYLVLTARDVHVEDFCMNSCASHFSTPPADETLGQQLPFAWVGNPELRCPGQCAWPFARDDEFGPPGPTLKSPNGDVGLDGLIINMAAMLAGTVTNPFNNGFYQGDAAYPLEAATACAGIFGPGAYPGFPGQLPQDDASGASFNVHGFWNSSRKFLVPALWDPDTLTCTPP